MAECPKRAQSGTTESSRKRKVWFRARECSFGHSLRKPSFRKNIHLPVGLGGIAPKADIRPEHIKRIL
jgi:hypothetical protein